MSHSSQIGRICSYGLWFLICVLPFLAIYVTKFKYKVKKIYVDENIPLYNYSDKPVVVSHLTDIHVTPNNPDARARLNRSLSYIHRKVKPSWALISGDLVDNYVGSKSPTASYQHEDHWKIYADAINSSGISKEELFEIFGNHDLWGLTEWDPVNSLPAKYTTIEMPDFTAFSHERRNVRIVAFTPQEFPTGYGPLAFILAILPKHLDRLEEILKQPTNCKYTILTCHYTHELLYPRSAKSKSGLTFKDMLKHYNITVYLNGHTHPRKIEPVHYGGVMELTARATKVSSDLTILTLDNNRINYKSINQYSEYNAIISHPVPQHLQVANTKDTTFPINVISFDPSQTKVFNVSGDATGTLTFKEYIDEENSVALYQMNATFESGIHTIYITGDLTDNVTFAVNCESGPFYESQRSLIDPKTGMVGFPMMFILFGIITIFIWVPFPYFNDTASYIIGSGQAVNWWLIIFCGPIVVGRALSKLEIWIKIFLTIVVLWEICLPITLYNFEGNLAMFFIWGYVTKGKYVKDVFSYVCGFVAFTGFISDIVFAGLVYLSILNIGWSYYHLFDLCVLIGTLGFGYWFCNLYVGEIAYYGVWVGSFPYFIFPVLAIIIYAVSAFFYYRKPTQPDVSSESDQEIKDGNTKLVQP